MGYQMEQVMELKQQTTHRKADAEIETLTHTSVMERTNSHETYRSMEMPKERPKEYPKEMEMGQVIQLVTQ